MTEDKKTELDTFGRERERTLGMGARKYANTLGLFELEKAFEYVGCTCHPYREQLNKLDRRYDAEKKEIDDRYRADLAGLGGAEWYKEASVLRNQISEVDRREHPKLDGEARQAYGFFPIWLMDKLRDGISPIGSSPQETCQAYAVDWMAGWRPRSLRE